MTPDDRSYQRVLAGAAADFGDDEAIRLPTTPPVSVFYSDGSYYCIDDTCTHEDYSLADGWISDSVVECTLHMAKFDLRTGAARCLPATRAVRTHCVILDDDKVFVDLPPDYRAPLSPVGDSKGDRCSAGPSHDRASSHGAVIGIDEPRAAGACAGTAGAAASGN